MFHCPDSAQLNFSGPEFVFAKFWGIKKKSYLATNLKLSGLGAGVRWFPAGLGNGMLNLLGKIRLGKAL
jgi:hypothetical protein